MNKNPILGKNLSEMALSEVCQEIDINARAVFAIAAMQGILANQCYTDQPGYEKNVAKYAVAQADALIAALAEKEDKA